MSQATERLLVRIDATTEQLRREMAQADKTVANSSMSISRRLAGMQKHFTAAGVAAAKWGVVAGTAAAATTTALVKSGLSTVDTLAKTSDKLGIATESLARYRFAAEQTGVAQKTADIAMQRFTRRLADAAAGAGPAVKAFDALGLSAAELVQLKPDEAFAKVADKMNLVENSSQKVSLAFKLFDSSGVDLLNTLSLGSSGLAELGAQADAAGLAISRIDAAKVEAANDAMNRVGVTVSGFSQQLAVQFAPALEGISDHLFGIATDSGGMAKAAEKAFNFMMKGAGHVGDAIRGIQIVIKALELGIKGVAFTAVKAFDVMAEAINDVAKMIPGLNANYAGSAFDQFTDDFEQDIEETAAELEELLTKEIPSTAMEKFVADTTKKHEVGAKKILMSQDDIQEGLQTTEQVTAKLATTTTVKTQEITSAWDRALQGTVERMDQVWAQAWTTPFSDLFDNTLDAFKTMWGEMAHIALTRPIIARISAGLGIGGLSSGAAAGSGSMGAGGILNGLGGMAGSGLSNAGAFFANQGMLGPAQMMFDAKAGLTATGAQFGGGLGLGTAITGGAGLAGGLLANQLFGNTTGLGSMGGGLAGGIFGASLGAAGGPLGALVGSLAGGAIESAFGFGEDNNGNNTGYTRFDLANGSFNSAGVGTSFNPENVSASAALAQQMATFAAAIGGSSASGRVDVDNNSGIKYGGVSYGQDTSAFMAAAYRDVIEGATELDEGLRRLLLDFNGTAAEIETFTGALIMLDDAAGVNGVTQAIQDFTAEQPSAMQAWRDQTAEVREMVLNFDGSANAASQLNVALQTNQAAAYQMAMAIQMMGEEMKTAATAQADYFRQSVMSPDELLQSRNDQRAAAWETINNATDPEQIAAAGEAFLNLNRTIFDSFDEAEKAAKAGKYADTAEFVGSRVQDRLDMAVKEMEIVEGGLDASVKGLLDATTGQQQAADTQVQAAEDFGRWVRQLITQGITVNVAGNTSEVNI